jgi:hypothetical protein
MKQEHRISIRQGCRTVGRTQPGLTKFEIWIISTAACATDSRFRCWMSSTTSTGRRFASKRILVYRLAASSECLRNWRKAAAFLPSMIRVDSGPEFISQNLNTGCKDRKITPPQDDDTSPNQPGKTDL